MSVPVHTYELMYVINGVLGDDQTKGVVRRVTKFVQEHGGSEVEVDEWGVRRLAYPIRKKRNGYYVNVHFRAPGTSIARLERALALQDDILRFLTLKMDAKMLRHYEERKNRAAEQAEGPASMEAASGEAVSGKDAPAEAQTAPSDDA